MDTNKKLPNLKPVPKCGEWANNNPNVFENFFNRTGPHRTLTIDEIFAEFENDIANIEGGE